MELDYLKAGESNREVEPLISPENGGDKGHYTKLGDPTLDASSTGDTYSEGPKKKDEESLPKTTNCQTMMHLIKGNVGTGILAMPHAFENSGILVGTLTLPIIGAICIHCMHSLMGTSNLLCRRFGYQSLDFAQVAQHAFLAGPEPFRRFSRIVKHIVNIFLLITQFGFCCVYYLFVATSIKQVIDNTISTDVMSIREVLAIMLPFTIVYSFLRNLRQLAVASTIANFIQMGGLCIIMYDLLHGYPSVTERPLAAPLSTWPLYFGISVYAFEGIGMILPLANEMQTPEAFLGCSGVLNTAMIIVACLYTGIGFFGYLKYGNDVEGSITLNLPKTLFYEMVRLMFALAIFLSYGLQLYVPFQIFWPWFKLKFDLVERFHKWQIRCIEFSWKILIVLITFGLAAAIPKLDLFIALVGAVASSSLALIIPPILEMFAFWEEDLGGQGWWWAMVCKNMAIFTFGILGFITGTYTSVLEINEGFLMNDTAATIEPIEPYIWGNVTNATFL